MSSLKLAETQSLAQRVTIRLRQAITEGEFPPGSNIPEEMLAQSFGVSRTPVREALNQLQIEGLVVIRRQVGSFVFHPDAEDIVLLCEFRLGMEPWAARLAYRHDRTGTIEDLEAVLDDMADAAANKDRLGYARSDTAFHDVFVNHCGNRYVQESYGRVSGRVAAIRTHFSVPVDIRDSVWLDSHRQLATMFETGDFAAFEALTHRHVTETRDALCALLAMPEPFVGVR